MKKFISVLLCLLFVLSFGSCGDTDNSEQSRAVTEDDTVPSSTVPDIPVLAEGANVLFAIIRPEDSTGITVDCGKDIRSKIKELSSSSPTFQEDWIGKDKYDPSSSEILIGLCDREESRFACENSSYESYAIIRMGAKIVIFAHTAEKLKAASDYFVSHIEAQDGNTVYTGGFMIEKSDNSEFLFNSENRLSDYVIAADLSVPSLKVAADTMFTAIRNNYSVELPIVDISTVADKKAIMIGAGGTAGFESAVTINGLYGIVASEQNLYLIGKNENLCTTCVEYFTENLINKEISNAPVIKKGENLHMDNDFFTISNELCSGSDIRVMSFNILCELWDDTAAQTMPDRAERVANILLHYSPDVVGLQEVSDLWYTMFSKYLRGEYEIADKRTETDETNFSPIAYNPSKVTLIDHGVVNYTQGNEPRLRVCSWAVFETVGDKTKFAVINTHWDLQKSAQVQKLQATEIAGLVAKLQNDYGVSVITTGDYNSKEESTPYKTYLELSGLKEAKYTAEKALYRSSSFAAIGTNPSTADGYSLDHIFGDSKVTFKFYTTIIDDYTCYASDHSPIFSDIKLN